MKLIVYNGSPRGKKSNSRILMDHFLKGFLEHKENEAEVCYLVYEKRRTQHLSKFKEATHIIMIMPLYVDSIPSLVKEFIEQLASYKGQSDNPALGFIIQSGFPESIHSKAVEPYFEKLSKRLQSQYIGTAIKGGVEGIQVQPLWMTKKLFKRMEDLGSYFANHGAYDPVLLQQLSKPEVFTKTTQFFFRILNKLNLFNVYWNSQLKQNNAFNDRFAKPY